jgi:hypothetical protein
MNARRSRNDSTQRLAEFRWWGCVLLAMFAVVQAAGGSAEPASRPELVPSDSTLLPLAQDAKTGALRIHTP